jgi:glycosyltransferase involved in cell wall biosynthesis
MRMQVVPVSIVIPTYNGQGHIREAVRSVMSQTCVPYELLISDSGSSDDTLNIIEEETAGARFPLRILPERTPGMVKNWNAAARAARGEYVKFLFQDDVLDPQCVERMWDVVARHPKVGFVWCARRVIAGPEIELHPVGKWLVEHTDLDRSHLRIRPVQCGRSILRSRRLLDDNWNKIGEPTCVMMKRSVFESLGGFNEQMKQLVDVEMWYRALAVTWAAFIEEPLASFRVHLQQMTVKNLEESEEVIAEWTKLMHSLASPMLYRCLHCAARRRVRLEMNQLRQTPPPPALLDLFYETARKAKWMRRCVNVARGA